MTIFTGYNLATTINSNEIVKWKVMQVNKETGELLLVADQPTTTSLVLRGNTGFRNSKMILNKVCDELWSTDSGKARSITVDDIDQYSSYDKMTAVNGSSSTGFYGGTRDYVDGEFFKEIIDKDGKIIGYEENKTQASTEQPVRMTQIYYSNGTVRQSSYTILPVVSINSNVQVIQENDGSWSIK